MHTYIQTRIYKYTYIYTQIRTHTQHVIYWFKHNYPLTKEGNFKN